MKEEIDTYQHNFECDKFSYEQTFFLNTISEPKKNSQNATLQTTTTNNNKHKAAQE